METIILEGKIVARSKNLRGILTYARKRGIDRVVISKNAEGSNWDATVCYEFSDGAYSIVQWASFDVAVSWTHARRSWGYVDVVLNKIQLQTAVYSITHDPLNRMIFEQWGHYHVGCLHHNDYFSARSNDFWGVFNHAVLDAAQHGVTSLEIGWQLWPEISVPLYNDQDNR